MKLQGSVVATVHTPEDVTNRSNGQPVRVTRREFGTIVTAGVTSVLLSGCGGGGSSNSSGANKLPINGGVGPSKVYVGATLSPGFDMGVNTSGGITNWVTPNPQGFMTCAYPAGQQWGAIFITAGKVTAAGAGRTYYDYSSFNFLQLDLMGAVGGESVSVGVKTDTDPDNGLEPLYVASNLTTNWQTFKIPLSSLVSGTTYPMSRFTHLYIVCELVFGSVSETIYFRNVQYEI